MNKHLIQLHRILSERLDVEELRTLCFYAGVSYDHLRGEGQPGKARALLEYVDKRGRISDLVDAGKEIRSDINWPEALARKGATPSVEITDSDQGASVAVQIFIQGDIAAFSEERRDAAVGALAGVLRILPESIKVYSVHPGSVVLNLGLPLEAVQRLRYLLQTNDAQLRLLRVKKVIFGAGTETWILQEGKFCLADGAIQIGQTRDASVHTVQQGLKYQIEAAGAQIGVIGDGARVEGIHFHAPQPRIPRQLPSRAEHFVGREEELQWLIDVLHPGQVVTLFGPGGIGKTALAAEALHRLPDDRFPDGTVFYSFYGRPDVALALEAIALAYGEEPRPGRSDAMQQILRDDESPSLTPRDVAQRTLAGRKALLVLDGAEEADDLGVVLAVRGACGVLVTTQDRSQVSAKVLYVEPLEQAPAVALLQAWGKDRASDTQSAQAVCTQVGGLPLAVRLAGRYLNQTREMVGEYLEWLKETPLAALDHGRRRVDSVPLMLDKSLTQVGDTACQTLGVVGLLALAPFDIRPVAAALETDQRQARRALGQLVGYGLLIRPGQRYEVFHPLVYTYARLRVTADDETVKRLARYYTELTKAESDKEIKDYRRLDPERAHMTAVLGHCADRQQWEAVVYLVRTVDDYLDIQGHWTERVTVLEMGIEAARASGNRHDEGAFLDSLGTTRRSLGQVTKAIGHYEQALSIFGKIDERENAGVTLGNLGNAYYSLGRYKQATRCYKDALEIAREINDQINEGNWLNGLGLVYANLNRFEQAIECWEQALKIAYTIGDRRNEGIRLNNLGIVHRRLSQVERAIEYFEQALAIAREVGDRYSEGNSLGNLGNAYADLGQTQQAIKHFEQQFLITREISDRHGEATACWNLGSIHLDMGQIDQTQRYLKQALAIFEEIQAPQADQARQILAELEAEG